MEESMTSSFASIVADRSQPTVVINPLPKEEYFKNETITVYFKFPEENDCPSYLDVLHVLPLDDAALPASSEDDTPPTVLSFSYCHWKVESGNAHFSISVKVDALMKSNPNMTQDGVVYIVQYMSSLSKRALAESHPFRVFPVSEDSMIDLPGVFSPSDDGLVILGTGSEADDPEIVEAEEVLKSLSVSPADSEDLAIVMSTNELRKMEDENKASTEKLRGFIDKYKNDLLEITKSNETLKQELLDKQSKVDALTAEKKSLKDEIAEVKRVMVHQQTLFQRALTERERQLRDEQKKSAQLTEENHTLSGHLENLKCCVEANKETKNILLQEIQALENEKAQLLEEKHRNEMITYGHVGVDTSDLEPAAKTPDQGPMEERIQELVMRLQAARVEYISLYKENKRKEKALENICNWASLAKSGMSLDIPSSTVPKQMSPSTSAANVLPSNDRKPKENESSPFESLCQSVPGSVYSLESLASRKAASCGLLNNIKSQPTDLSIKKESTDSQNIALGSGGDARRPFHFIAGGASPPKTEGILLKSNLPCSSAAKPLVLNNIPSGGCTDGGTDDGPIEEEDLIDLSLDGGAGGKQCSLPPRQKRKMDQARRGVSLATASAGPGSSSSLRTVGRKPLFSRGRHNRPSDSFRLQQAKRDFTGLEQNQESQLNAFTSTFPGALGSVPNLSSQNKFTSSIGATRQRTASKRMQTVMNDDDEQTTIPPATAKDWVMTGAKRSPAEKKPEQPAENKSNRGRSTYSAACLISDLETDASNTEEETTSSANPNICPLCVTSILDYEDHMREAHQKQPCPICGYVFDTNIPLYVMTYHIERHLEENQDGPTTQPQTTTTPNRCYGW